MPTYPYFCPKCEKNFTVVKFMSEWSRVERCECSEIGQRIYTPPVTMIKQEYKPHYNPAFGKVLYNKRHQDELIRVKSDTEGVDLVEFGNQDLDNIQKRDDNRILERAQDRWDNADREMLYED